MVCNIFSHSVGVLFIMLIVFFAFFLGRRFLVWYSTVCLLLLLLPFVAFGVKTNKNDCQDQCQGAYP